MSWQLEPITIRELTGKFTGEFKIICVIKEGKAIEPSLDYTLQRGVGIVVMGPKDNLKK